MEQVTYGMFAYRKKELVYVSKVIDGMAYICYTSYPNWHKKVPVSELRPC